MNLIQLKKRKGRAHGYRQSGKGAGFCSICGKRGGVIDTRIHAQWIRRRRRCSVKTHPRWTTIELSVERKAGEMARIANILQTLDINGLLDTIGRLKTALRKPKVGEALRDAA